MTEWVSEELKNALAQLSPRQARSIVRIVEAEIAGRSLRSLLIGADRICSPGTYYGRRAGSGWRNTETYRRTLELARRDFRAWMLEKCANEALMLLAQTAPEAVRALQQQVIGDPAALETLGKGLLDPNKVVRAAAAKLLGETELLAATPLLNAALEREEDGAVRQVIIEALGRIAGSTHPDRRAALTAVLDRAAMQTASKQVLMVSDFDELDDDEYKRIEEYCAAQDAGRRTTQ